MFDNNFTDEFNYYSSKKYIFDDIIHNYNFAIFDDDLIIGYINLNVFIDEDNNVGCNINPIIVFKKYRNRGYGSKIISLLKNREFKEFIKFFECVIDKNNIVSYKLFIKCGFELIKDENNFIYMKYNVNQ